MKFSPCPQCESNEVYRRANVGAMGGDGPNLLPGLAPWYRGAKMTVVVCKSCGLVRFFASAEARAKLTESDKWSRA